MQNDLVLLHGWGMNQGVWELVQTDLESIYSGNIKRLDLPGYGEHTFRAP